MLSRITDERIICFPCRQHWDEKYHPPKEGETFVVRVVNRQTTDRTRVEFVEPIILISSQDSDFL